MRSRCLRVWNKVLQRKKRNGAAWCRNISSHKRLVFYSLREDQDNSVFTVELEPNERFTIKKYPKENVLEDVNWSGDRIFNWRDERKGLLLAGLNSAANFIKEMER